MGFWVVENATGVVKDYSADGSITFDPRFHTTRQDLDLPPGDQPGQYQWNGTAIVKNPPPTDSALHARMEKFLIAAVLYVLDQENEVRTQPMTAFPALTPAQARQGIVEKWRSLP